MNVEQVSGSAWSECPNGVESAKRRWDSEFLTVRRLLESGCLGKLLTFDSRIEVHCPSKRGEPRSGGMLRDLGSHLVDQALQLFGPVATVYAEVDFCLGNNELDDRFFLSLKHCNGVRSHLRADCMQSISGPRLRLTGEEASYQIDAIDGQEAALRAGERPVNNGRWGIQEHRNWGWLAHGEERELVPSERGRYDLFYAGLAQAMAGNSTLPVKAGEILACLEVLDAARHSALTGEVVRFPKG